MVERQPSKLNVASSTLVSRSNFLIAKRCIQMLNAMKSAEEIREYNRLYYRKNRKHLLLSQKEKNRRLAKNRRKWLVEYKKSQKCVRCGESHPATLTFHHKNNAEKSFEIGNIVGLGVSIERILKEIEKCEVLCANCHAIEHLAYLYE